MNLQDSAWRFKKKTVRASTRLQFKGLISEPGNYSRIECLNLKTYGTYQATTTHPTPTRRRIHTYYEITTNSIHKMRGTKTRSFLSNYLHIRI